MLVEEKTTSTKFLIVVTNKDLLKFNINRNINFLFPIYDYSVGFTKCFKIDEIKEDKSFLYINRILDTKMINKLKEDLKSIDSNIKGICFTDLGVIDVVKELKLPLELIYMQEHNTTNYESINYYLEYVDSVLLSTDITKEEIEEILSKVNKPLVVPYFVLASVMYSRRNLLTNYQIEFNIPKNREVDIYEPISKQEFKLVENESGTVAYTKNFIDYRNIESENILYRFIMPYNLSNENVLKIINKEDLSDITTDGFLNKKTYYNLKKDGE